MTVRSVHTLILKSTNNKYTITKYVRLDVWRTAWQNLHIIWVHYRAPSISYCCQVTLWLTVPVSAVRCRRIRFSLAVSSWFPVVQILLDSSNRLRRQRKANGTFVWLHSVKLIQRKWNVEIIDMRQLDLFIDWIRMNCIIYSCWKSFSGFTSDRSFNHNFWHFYLKF